MKTLNRTLSLVLVLVMVLGFFGVAGASFKDQAEVKYAEAVDVMSGIGAIDGYADGTFNPKGDITREEAAKLVVYSVLGKSVAEKLSVSATGFSDVAATRWSAPYIAYLVGQGVINGMGDGTFAPTEKVTGYAMAKMMLVAAGYGAKGEFTGNGWELAVAVTGNRAGVFAGATGVDYTKPATREEATLYAFNGIVNVPTVTYNKLTEQYDKAAHPAVPVHDINGDGYYSIADADYRTLVKNASGSDAFGRPASVWTYGAGAKVIASAAAKPVVTYNAATTATKIAADLRGYKLANAAGNATYNIENSSTPTFTAGSIKYSNTKIGAAFGTFAGSNTTAGQIAALTGNGKLVEVYANSTNVITAIVDVTYTVATVSAVTTTSTQTSYGLTDAAAVTVTKIDYVDDVLFADTIVPYAGMAKGDVVTYALVDGTAYVYPTTTVNGAQSAFNTANNTITVAGKNYTVGSAVVKTTSGPVLVAIGDFSNGTAAANYYLDQFGYAVKTTAAAAYGDYARIVGAYGAPSTTVDGTVPTAQVKVVLADGTVATHNLKVEKIKAGDARIGVADNTFADGKTTVAANDYVIAGTKIVILDGTTAGNNTAANMTSAIGVLGDVIGYAISDNVLSAQKLTAASGSVLNGVYFDTDVDGLGYGITSKTGSTGATVLTTTSTVYVIRNTTTNTVTVYTGNTGLPATAAAGTMNDANVVMAVGTTAGLGTAKIVFADTTGFGAVTTTNYVFIDSSEYTTSLTTAGTVYTYEGVKADGTTIALNATSTLTSSGVYAYNADNTVANGGLKATTTDTTTADHTAGYIYDATLTVAGQLLGVMDSDTTANKFYNITADTKTVYVDSTVSAINGQQGYVVLAVVNGQVTTNVATIFIVG